ncbi:MAG: transcription antitermination factor NusB [Phycisphaerae bacterium]
MTRNHKVRRLALQGLCCLDVQGQSAIDLVELFVRDTRESQAVAGSAWSMLCDTWHSREEADAILRRHARNWDLSRLALVDRNILRLAVREMTHQDTPPKVVLSEALKLAREFSTAESPRFVNGVLDAVFHELQDE